MPAMASFALAPDQQRTLAAICDTLMPSLSEREEADLAKKRPELDASHLKVWCRSSASDLGVPAAIEETLSRHLPSDAQQDISLLLTAMSSRLGMLLLCGAGSAFPDLPPRRREQCLSVLQTSAIGQKRKAFISLKLLVGLKALGRDTSGVNPHNPSPDANSIWSALDFEGAPSAEEARAVTAATGREEFVYRMINESISEDTTLDMDVVVVGSGCGGGVVAAELAQAGRRVLVIEKAKYYRRDELSGQEDDGFDKLYERGGLVAAEDTGLSVLAGSAWGGGSAVNWGCCLRTPDHVKQEWSSRHGLTGFTDGSFDSSLDAVCHRIGVTKEGVAHSRNNELLIEACQKLGYPIDVAPQNMVDVGPQALGAFFIGAGDRLGNKQSTPETFLKDAATAAVPAKFADRCFVERVLHRGGVAQGVRCRIVGSDGVTEHTLIVNAPIVVVSAGSLHSPALLLRSGLPNRNRQIGKNLRLHPVVGCGAIMPRESPVCMWRGAPMTTVSNVVAAGPDGDDYGARIECPVALPGIMSSIAPWETGAAWKDLLLDYKRLMTLIVLSRDREAGEVRLDKEGNMRVFYKPSEHDDTSLKDGLEKSIRLMEAAGAESLLLSQFRELQRLPPASDPKARTKELERIIADARRIGFPTYQAPLFSAHQMGTCRMGTNPKTSVVKPTCESWECAGLYVIDASAFPTSSGTNPMVTTLAVAHMAAQGLKTGGRVAEACPAGSEPLAMWAIRRTVRAMAAALPSCLSEVADHMVASLHGGGDHP